MTSEVPLSTVFAPSGEQLETVRIQPGCSPGLYWRDLLAYREVLFFLAWRDVLVRYKQAIFGIAWAVFRPLLTMAIFTIVFGKLGKFPSFGMPFPLLVFTGLWPWLFFAGAAVDSCNSLVANQNLVSKVYFPRLLVPLAAIAASLVDFLFSGVILVALMCFFHVPPSWRLLTLPLFLGVAIAAAASVGIWFSALNVKYRDLRFVLPVLVQIGLYLSPVAFAARTVPEGWQLLYSLNPMVGVIQGFRWAVFGQEPQLYWPGFALSAALLLLMFSTGLYYFRRTEKTLADFI